MGFKEDVDFARFLSMGAIGAARVAEDLRDAHGHRPIELERYAMSNKVWQTKVKRLRMADVVCLRCGRRVESRAKSRLGIILSHSETPGREWSAGGMRDDDLYAFVYVNVKSDPPRVGVPLYLTRGALAASRATTKVSGRKAASEGSEVWLTWPSYVPAASGILVHLSGEGDGTLVIDTNGVRSRPYWHWRNWQQRRLYVQPGDQVTAEQTVVAGVVDAPSDINCPGDTWEPAADLDDAEEVDRFVAVKAAGFLGRTDLIEELIAIANHPETDWRLRLEARATLARLGAEIQVEHLIEVATHLASPDDARMEAVFILTEINDPTASAALHQVALADVPSEVRSAAVWGLGQGARPDPCVVDFIADPDDAVALHAASSIEAVDEETAARLLAQLDGEPRLAEVSAALLQRHGRLEELLTAARWGGGTGRLLALRTLGDFPPHLLENVGGSDVINEFGGALEPLWRGQADWIRVGGAEELDALATERVRYGPEF